MNADLGVALLATIGDDEAPPADANGSNPLAHALGTDRLNNPRVRHLKSVVSATTPASGTTTTVLNLGQPKVGRLWNVTYLSVGGADAVTVVTGATLASFAGPLPDPSLNVPLDALLDPANSTVVPNSASWNKDQVWVRRPDHLYVIVYGAPVSQALFAVARFLEYAIDDRETHPEAHYAAPLPAPGRPALSSEVELGGPTGLTGDNTGQATPNEQD